MSKKKHKKAKKSKQRLITSPEINSFVHQTLAQYAEPHMTIKFIYEGKKYEGVVPCVGEVE